MVGWTTGISKLITSKRLGPGQNCYCMAYSWHVKLTKITAVQDQLCLTVSCTVVYIK